MKNSFKALVLTNEAGASTAGIQTLSAADLPDGDVLVAVSHSSLNYKDAMALTGTGKIVRQFPMVPGIDLAGTVVESASAQWRAGDAVVLTGWGVGERFWGGYSQLQRVKSEWLVALPAGMTPLQAMTLGTAGLTAMLCVMALQEAGVRSGTILVTGASGGVGSVATALLAQQGYAVTALSSRPDENRSYLQQLGAQEVLGVGAWQTKPAPLAAQRWAGAVDGVGGVVLAQLLSEINYGGAVAACGLAGGVALETTVLPFILRGVRLLGVDSVMCPLATRTRAWQRLAADCPAAAYSGMQRVVALEALAGLASEMMAGQAHGRVVVDLNA
jgi:acrylyl-CoA reductase (NADPH)